MSSLESLIPHNLYHSYIVEGDPVLAPLSLRTFLKKRGDVQGPDYDIFYEIYDSFTIDNSRTLKEWYIKKGIQDTKRICIIGAKFITREAEHSLLKIIEEPKQDTHFFLVVPNSSVLLDTLRSRTHIIKVDSDENVTNVDTASIFIEKTIKQRLELIAEIIERNKNNKSSGGLRFEALEFLISLEKYHYEEVKHTKQKKEEYFKIKEIEKCRIYLDSPGASVKMLLEHIALVL